MQIAKILEAVKTAPNYRAQVEHDGVTVEVIGAPGKFRWTFDYLVRIPAKTSINGRPRTAFGRRNAENILEAWPIVAINTNIATFI
jgi:hypothetical protein